MSRSILNTLLSVILAAVCIASCGSKRDDRQALADSVTALQPTLPVQMGDGIEMVRVEYGKAENTLLYEYTAPEENFSDTERQLLREGLSGALLSSVDAETARVIRSVRPSVRILIRTAQGCVFDETLRPEEYIR